MVLTFVSTIFHVFIGTLAFVSFVRVILNTFYKQTTILLDSNKLFSIGTL